MNPKLSLVPLFLALPSLAPAHEAVLTAYAATRPFGTEISARLEGVEPGAFAVFAVPMGQPVNVRLDRPVARGVVTPALMGLASFVIPSTTELTEEAALDIYVAYRGASGFEVVGPRSLPLGGGGIVHCQELSFNHAIGQVEDPVKGQVMGENWALVGMHISATNNTIGHPDLAIIFDSADVSGGDDDLMTPGPGAGNNVAYGNLLIIAENDVDANKDGLIDDPDDEQFGGVIAFDFDNPATICSVTLVDIDDFNKTHLRFHRGANVTTIPVDNMGDNSVQTITFLEQRVDRFEVVFGGSGAIASAMIEPCPLLINLDENIFGVPLDVAAGLWITDQFAGLGVTFSGFNNTPGHPDKVILFDSENPTGGDFDLMTPGPGINNDEPLGLVLIIAENDIDRNMDGLVDDPDDEEHGGRMIIEFDTDVTFFSAKILDVDGLETDVFEFFDGSNNLLETLTFEALGDNSVQTVQFKQPLTHVRRIELAISGSGAITRLVWCPGNLE